MLRSIIFLLWSSVDVNSQTAPYITFMGETLPNNSYVNVSLVGDYNSSGAGVQCHTDLTTCCSRYQGLDNGDWYAPNGDKLAFHQSGILSSTFERRESQKVTLYHRSWVVSDHQSGMYRCDIAVNGSGRGTVYIGIYETGGIQIPFCPVCL